MNKNVNYIKNSMYNAVCGKTFEAAAMPILVKPLVFNTLCPPLFLYAVWSR